MGTRRLTRRQNRGRQSASSGVLSLPPNLITSATKRFWHDGQDNATIVPGTGVAGWLDKFANGYNVAMATGSKQPTVVTTAFGGRQALRFTSASSQELVLVDGPRVTNFVGGNDVAFEWWFVLQLNSITGARYFGCTDSSTDATSYNMFPMAAGTWLHQRRDGVGANQQFSPANVAPANTTPYLMRCGYTGTATAWTINGTVMTSGAVDTGALTLDRLIYGAFGNGAGAHGSFLEGWIGESIGFTGTLSAPEAAGLTNYLKAKWGFTF